MYEYKPNPRICRKAARIWTAHMVQPAFDQLGATREEQDAGSREREGIMQAMTLSICKDTQPWQLELFEIQLYMMLMSPRPLDLIPDHLIPEHLRVERKDGNRIRPPIKEELIWQHYPTYIGTDYDPDIILRAAGCWACGLPSQQFPIKSRMSINSGSLNYAFGYAAHPVWLYPYPESADTPDDEHWSKRWLRTSLSGSGDDIKEMMILAANYKTEWIERDGEEPVKVPREITDAATNQKIDEVMSFLEEARESRQPKAVEAGD